MGNAWHWTLANSETQDQTVSSEMCKFKRTETFIFKGTFHYCWWRDFIESSLKRFLIFNINDYSVKKFGSQGQQKSLLIALKLAQFDFLKSQNKNNPILLLDDIFDKLDKNRVKQIINLVSANDFGQIFISDTDEQRTKESIKEINNSNKIFKLWKKPYSFYILV